MQRALGIALSLIILTLAGRGADLWATALVDSIRLYRSPLRMLESPATPPEGPMVDRVVQVIINGLDQDLGASRNLPTMKRLVDAGASASMIGWFPAGTDSSHATLLTGAGPAFNDARPLVGAESRPLSMDNVLAAAHAQEMQTGLAGSLSWTELFPNSFDRLALPNGQDSAAEEAALVTAALVMLENDDLQFILVELNQLGVAIQKHGVDSPEAEAATRQTDAHLDLIVRRLDLDRSTLIVSAEPVLDGATTIPNQQLVLIGRGTIPGRYSRVQQIDLAPTLATLLGLRLPVASQGRPLTEMLRLSEPANARLAVAVASQRLELVAAYMDAIDQPASLATARQDLDFAQALLANGNFSGARQLAELLGVDLDREMKLATNSRLATERQPRLIQVLGGLVLVVAFSGWQRQRYWLAATLAGLAIVGVFHSLYRFQQGIYSLNLIDNVPAFAAVTDRYVWLALGSGSLVLVLLFILRDEGDFWLSVATGYQAALVATLGLGVPALIAFWQHGALVTWFLPDGSLLFWQFSSLRQAAEAATWGAILPWLIGLTSWSLAIAQQFIRVRRRRQIRSQAVELVEHQS